MFEHYTEKARRAVFFARYEASQYGNSCIETEHLLLGLWREDLALRGILKDTGIDSEIRAAIERLISRGAPISTSIEVPLSAHAKKNASYIIEETLIISNNQLVALVLWKNALVASMERVWMHRMTVVLVPNGDRWAIVSMHITPVQP